MLVCYYCWGPEALEAQEGKEGTEYFAALVLVYVLLEKSLKIHFTELRDQFGGWVLK